MEHIEPTVFAPVCYSRVNSRILDFLETAAVKPVCTFENETLLYKSQNKSNLEQNCVLKSISKFPQLLYLVELVTVIKRGREKSICNCIFS